MQMREDHHVLQHCDNPGRRHNQHQFPNPGEPPEGAVQFHREEDRDGSHTVDGGILDPVDEKAGLDDGRRTELEANEEPEHRRQVDQHEVNTDQNQNAGGLLDVVLIEWMRHVQSH